MYICRIENSRGEILTLTQRESDFQVLDIDGLKPPKAQINRSSMGMLDGTRFNSSKLEERNIVIILKLNGDVEKNRMLLYNYFVTKDWCKIYYMNGARKVCIEGYVEDVDVSPFSQDERMQISIICPIPYFKGIDEIIEDVYKVLNGFEFPFAFGDNLDEFVEVEYDTLATETDEILTTEEDEELLVDVEMLTDPMIEFSTYNADYVTTIFNDGDSDTGLVIDVYFHREANRIHLTNTRTGETLRILYVDGFLPKDKLTINTNSGFKSITLLRDGETYNLMTSLVRPSTFFQLKSGANGITYRVDGDTGEDDVVNIRVHYSKSYRGV